jgi:hypothetical protein
LLGSTVAGGAVTGPGPGIPAVAAATSSVPALLLVPVEPLALRAVLAVRVVVAVRAVLALLAVLIAGAAATSLVRDFVVLADGFGLADVVVAVALFDCFGVALVLVLVLVLVLAAALSLVMALALVDAEAPGLGEGSVLGVGDRDVPILGEPVPDGGSVVEPVEPDEVLPGAVLFVALALGVALLLGVLVGVVVLLAVALLVGEVVLPGVALLVGVVLLVGVAVGLLDVVGVGVGLGFVGVGVGVGLGGKLSGSHCWLVPLTVASVSAGARPGVLDWAADAATVNPAAAATMAPPRTRLTPTGRTCAKRMEALPVLFVAAAERLIQYGMATSGPNARLVRYAQHCTPNLTPGATVSTTQ